MTKYEILKETELFVLDMDGTFYLDNDVIDGALDFLDEVKNAGNDLCFLQTIHPITGKPILINWKKWGCNIGREHDHHIRRCDDPVSERVLSRKMKSILSGRRISKIISAKWDPADERDAGRGGDRL